MARWVKNKAGTAGRRPKGGAKSHLDDWREVTGSSRTTCAAKGCSNVANVGAHVLKVHGNAYRDEHLVPFCDSHNRRSGRIQLKDSVPTVTVRG